MPQLVKMAPMELIEGFNRDEIKGMYLAVCWDKHNCENLGLKGNQRMLDIIAEAGNLTFDERLELDLRAEHLFNAGLEKAQ